jgi:hypothetical protein
MDCIVRCLAELASAWPSALGPVHTPAHPSGVWASVWDTLQSHLQVSAPQANANDANLNGRDFGWEIAHAAVSRRPPISLVTIVARTGGYTYDAKVCDSSILCRPVLIRNCFIAADVRGAGLRHERGGAAPPGVGRAARARARAAGHLRLLAAARVRQAAWRAHPGATPNPDATQAPCWFCLRLVCRVANRALSFTSLLGCFGRGCWRW